MNQTPAASLRRSEMSEWMGAWFGQAGSAWSLPKRQLFVGSLFFPDWRGDEVEIEDEVGGGPFALLEDLAEVITPHFGVTALRLREASGPLAERAAGTGAFTEFGEPVLVRRHGTGSPKGERRKRRMQWHLDKVRWPTPASPDLVH